MSYLLLNDSEGDSYPVDRNYAYEWLILEEVESAEFIYEWTVLEPFEELYVYIWDIYDYISNAWTYKWNIGFYIQRTFTYLWGVSTTFGGKVKYSFFASGIKNRFFRMFR